MDQLNLKVGDGTFCFTTWDKDVKTALDRAIQKLVLPKVSRTQPYEEKGAWAGTSYYWPEREWPKVRDFLQMQQVQYTRS
jgi:hypothetical protein